MNREDNATCTCGKPVHRQHNPPCEHGVDCCDTCDRVDVCPDCRREEFMAMCKSGTYTERADPLHTSSTDQGQELRDVLRDMRVARKASTFCPTHNRPKKTCHDLHT